MMTHQCVMFMLPSTYSQGVGDLTIRNFGANSLSLVLRPTNALSTLHNACSPSSKSPSIAQDLVTHCGLGFMGVVISNH